MRQNQTPDWRWQRAKMLVDHGMRPSRSRDDSDIVSAWRFLKRAHKEDIKSQERLANDMPDIYNARIIYEDYEGGLRWIFEASVMADKDLDEMSEYLQTDSSVLETYERLFFDVRTALPYQGCIVANVLMPMTTNSVVARDPDIMWKALAYFGQWDVVKSCWELGHISPAAMDFLNQANHSKIIANAFDALHTTKVNNFNAVDHARLALDKARNDFEMGTAQRGEGATTALGHLLSSIKLTIRPQASELPAEEQRLQQLPQPKLEDRAIELEPIKEKGKLR